MKTHRYLNIKSVIADLYRDLGIDEISESDAIEWAANALEHLRVKDLYSINTAIINVEHYQCEMPEGCVNVLEIAKHRHLKQMDYYNDKILMEYDSDNPCGCDDCDKEPEKEFVFCQKYYVSWGYYFPLKSYTTHPEPKFDWMYVEPSYNNFFMASTQDKSGVDEYRIDDGKILFSFEKGVVAVSYMGIRLDEEGFPLVPDDISAREAIVRYVTFKYMQRQWYLGREGYQDKMMKAEQDWHWYCKQFKNKMKMPSEDDLRKFISTELRLFPSLTKDYFGYLNILKDIHIQDKEKCVE